MNDSIYDEYAQLAAGIRAGNENAFTEMYRKSERLVYATCLGILRDPDDAVDATQDTYVTVYTKIGTLEDDRKFLGWLKMIAANKALEAYRRKKRNVSYDDTIAADEELTGNDDLESLPDSFITEQTRRDTLRAIMQAELSDVQYQTVVLYYYDELPVETIAKLMECPEGTVKTRLKASRIKIRAGIEKYEKDNDDRFAAAVPLPFLTRFLAEDAKGLTVPDINIMSVVKDHAYQASQNAGSESASGGNAHYDYPKDSRWAAAQASSQMSPEPSSMPETGAQSDSQSGEQSDRKPGSSLSLRTVTTMAIVLTVFILIFVIGAIVILKMNKDNEDESETTAVVSDETESSEAENSNGSEATESDDTTEATETETADIEPVNAMELSVGDYVVLGTYEQDNDLENGHEPIKWQVLDVEDGMALLISKHVLNNHAYNEYGSTSRPWNSSSIRTWLNGEGGFVGMAFTDEERSILVDRTDYSVTDEYGEVAGDILGEVFLLSYDEVVEYFAPTVLTVDTLSSTTDYAYTMDLLCSATPYASHNSSIDEEFTQHRYNELTNRGFIYDQSVIDTIYSNWWLRSSMSWDSWFTAEGHALLVDSNGRISLGTAGLFNEKDHDRGVRPCVWIDLSLAGDYLVMTDGTDEDWMVTEEVINCEWTIEGTTLIITGTEIPGSWDDRDTPWYDSAASITEVEINGLEDIPNGLFEGFTSLQCIRLSDSVTKARHSAFEDLPEGVVIIYQGVEYTTESIYDVL